jgi:hypothetical protein
VSGANFYAYVLRVFKRTNYSTEVYEAITDTIRELKRRFAYDEAKVEKDVTDTIGALGEYKIDLDTDFGQLIGDVLIQASSGARSEPLNKVTKEEFDRRHPDPIASGVGRGFPRDYCIFAGQILLGPAPDSTAYQYHYSYEADDGATVASGTTNVVFSATYPEMLRHGTLMRLYGDVLKIPERAMWHKQAYEEGILIAERRERRNTGAPLKQKYHGI